MIRNARQIAHGKSLECDVCIVGGGAAGISIAVELAKTNLDVILLEAGEKREDRKARDVYRGYCSGEKSHEPLTENRRRQWGGTTGVWGGRCVPFDAIDFQRRDWVPYSGWPFSKAELDPYYCRAMDLCQAGEYSFRAEEALPQSQSEMIAAFGDDTVRSNLLERWSPPTHFGRRYEKLLRSSRNVTAFLSANCVRVQLAPNGQRAESVEVAAAGHVRFRVKARVFVVAMGCLESTRLLLASNDIQKDGIGNRFGNLGCFLMSHPSGTFSAVRLRNSLAHVACDFERDTEGVYCRRRFWITAEAQQEARVLNGIGFFHRAPLGSVQDTHPLMPAVYLSKYFFNTFRRNRLGAALALLRRDRESLSGHARILLRGGWLRALPELGRIVRYRVLSKRRLPMVLQGGDLDRQYLYFQTEHAPNPESRLLLHDENDAFGMPRLLAKIRFSELEIRTVLYLHRFLRRRFDTSGTGEFRCAEEELLAFVNEKLENFYSMGHHAGTTRMSADPSAGVVNPNCCVHGVDNLFIASSAVFPTSSHANPTLTIVALAVRLAEHLGRDLYR